MTHDLKILAHHFRDILSGEKTWELRIDDRGFRDKGDRLRLREWDDLFSRYTGREVTVDVLGLWDGLDGLADGYCLMSIKATPDA